MNNSSQTTSSQVQSLPFSEVAKLANNETIFTTSMEDSDLTSNFGLPSYSVVFSVTFIIILISIAGIVGNGMVIWLLGFCLKRNPFTTYILNLAVADIGVLVCITVECILLLIIIYLPGEGFYIWGLVMCPVIQSLMYITDQLLLTTISIDRCVAVLFPLWYRCHRPPHLSRIVCILLWVLSFLILGLNFLLQLAKGFILLQCIVNVAICTPVMSVSTIILFVKICTKSQQQKRGKLLMAVSLAVFFFLIFGLPVNYMYVAHHFYIFSDINVSSLLRSNYNDSKLDSTKHDMPFPRVNMLIVLQIVALLCTVFNCSINPLIYFLVGRKKKGQSRLSMKIALQRVFKEKENWSGQDGPTAETQF